ncbi:type II toxin-antitoxin system RelE/ParE family toxin [Polaromonas sp.]|uniref:type II toxin-antitoxin system RelE/ParE family toxin n=1 Tax=Polaromonas sp. TaxID=1869339 RepID=UPI00286D1F98|nr:type II toxin-antitoxin system RelE/ParE family toxin [Polaromonas sp.]
MTRLLISDGAAADLERLCDFLLESLPEEAVRTADIILDALEILKNHPAIGRPVSQGLKELVISRGRTGYLALYLYDEDADMVAVLALRHQREVGYRIP